MWEQDLAPFGVALHFDEDRARISLRGEVDVATGAALVDAATSAVARYRFVEIDLAEATSLSEPGVRALVKVTRFAEAYGSLLGFTGATGSVADDLAGAGLRSFSDFDV